MGIRGNLGLIIGTEKIPTVQNIEVAKAITVILVANEAQAVCSHRFRCVSTYVPACVGDRYGGFRARGIGAVGLPGSVFFGAFILFLFSMGMGIPLILGAMVMSKALPLLARMGLASAILMMGFSALLTSGNYMVLTEWVYRIAGIQLLP